MRYIVEIDDQTDKGAQLITFIEKLHAPKKAVVMRKEKPLTDGEMGLPGPKPSKAQLEEWLEPKEDEEEFTLDELKVYIENRRSQKRAKKKAE
jgi:hypothetical protein